jgi:hypothetical protein
VDVQKFNRNSILELPNFKLNSRKFNKEIWKVSKLELLEIECVQD